MTKERKVVKHLALAKGLLLGLNVFFFGCSKTEVLHDLTEIEVNRLLRQFSEVGLSGEKQRQADGRWMLSVPDSEQDQALHALQELRMFQTPRKSVALQSSFSASRDEQRFVYERALSAALEDTLKVLDGVLDARVHLHLPPRDPVFGSLLEKEFRPSASVLLIQDNGFTASAGSLAMMVAAAAGMKGEDVAVILQSTAESTEECPGLDPRPLSPQKGTGKVDENPRLLQSRKENPEGGMCVGNQDDTV